MRAALIVSIGLPMAFHVGPVLQQAEGYSADTVTTASGRASVVGSAGLSELSPQGVVIEVFETIGVTDAARVLPPALIELLETVSVADAPRVLPPAIIDVAEVAAVSDAVPQPAITEPKFMVTSTDDVDDGGCDLTHCSFREAINAALASVRVATVAFDIPGQGPHTIQPTSPLPDITAPLVIDGYTQAGASPNTNGPGLGSNAVLMIELDGSNAGDGVNGLVIRGSGITVRGLAINRFPGLGDGIQVITGDDNAIQGNFIGTDITGTQAAGNDIGVLIAADAKRNVIGTDGDGVDDAAERNVISGNGRSGVRIQRGGSAHETDDNVVAGNLIGTDASGTAAVPNVRGVLIFNGPERNRIGSDGDGVADAVERNVISGNTNEGVNIDGSAENLVAGNFIGTDITGGAALGNGAAGVAIRSAAGNTIHDNVIAGNGGDGVLIVGQNEPDITPSTRNVVQGNDIGTDPTGTVEMGNARHGVFLVRVAAKNTIGGTTPEAGNTIAFNGGAGVFVEEATSIANMILSNAIFANGGLGIDLAPQGVTLNDPADLDEGPNDLQNFPIVTSVAEVAESSSLHPDRIVTGTLASTPNTPFTIQLFATPVCDVGSHGEGATLLASVAVATDGQGEAEFTMDVTAPVEQSAFLTATATVDTTGSTSEFSRCRPVGYTVALGGQVLKTEVLGLSPSGGPGFVLEADPAAGPQVAIVKLCGVSPIKMTAGDRIAVGCGSAVIAVEVGPVEIQLDEHTEAIVPADALVTVEEVEAEQIQIKNDSPAGSEPVQIAVGGIVVGEIGAGATLDEATVQLVKAEVKREEDDEDDPEDEVEVEGYLVVGAAGDGFDVLEENVSVTLGTFSLAIPAGAFEADDGEFEYEAEIGEDGEVELKIRDDGWFKLEVEEIDLSGLDLGAPVPFGIGIGDDFGSTAIPFDEDGEFKGPAASAATVLAGAFDLHVGPDSLTVARGADASFTVTLGGGGVFAGKEVSLSCADLPAGAACAFAPPTLTPDADGASSLLTVTTDGSYGGHQTTSGRAQLPLGLALAFLAVGALLLCSNGRRRRTTLVSLGLLLVVVGLYTACDDDGILAPGQVGPVVPPGTYAFQVVATADGLERAAPVTLIVRDRAARHGQGKRPEARR